MNAADLIVGREQQILQDLRARGFRVTRRGVAWLIRGPGVELLTVDLRLVHPVDLQPGQVRR